MAWVPIHIFGTLVTVTVAVLSIFTFLFEEIELLCLLSLCSRHLAVSDTKLELDMSINDFMSHASQSLCLESIHTVLYVESTGTSTIIPALDIIFLCFVTFYVHATLTNYR